TLAIGLILAALPARFITDAAAGGDSPRSTQLAPALRILEEYGRTESGLAELFAAGLPACDLCWLVPRTRADLRSLLASLARAVAHPTLVHRSLATVIFEHFPTLAAVFGAADNAPALFERVYSALRGRADLADALPPVWTAASFQAAEHRLAVIVANLRPGDATAGDALAQRVLTSLALQSASHAHYAGGTQLVEVAAQVRAALEAGDTPLAALDAVIRLRYVGAYRALARRAPVPEAFRTLLDAVRPRLHERVGRLLIENGDAHMSQLADLCRKDFLFKPFLEGAFPAGPSAWWAAFIAPVRPGDAPPKDDDFAMLCHSSAVAWLHTLWRNTVPLAEYFGWDGLERIFSSMVSLLSRAPPALCKSTARLAVAIFDASMRDARQAVDELYADKDPGRLFQPSFVGPLAEVAMRTATEGLARNQERLRERAELDIDGLLDVPAPAWRTLLGKRGAEPRPQEAEARRAGTAGRRRRFPAQRRQVLWCASALSSAERRARHRGRAGGLLGRVRHLVPPGLP
ncbi:MAG: hypothetical protein ACO4BU_11465, partial [Phycisphaerales bacterium]